MPNWYNYSYCKKCDRPLQGRQRRRIRHHQGYKYDNGIRYHCIFCHEIDLGRPSVLGLPFVLCIAVFFSAISVAYIYYDTENTTQIAVWTTVTVMMFGVHILLRLKCKPIYDRWVHRHGIDPGNWPSSPKSD